MGGMNKAENFKRLVIQNNVRKMFYKNKSISPMILTN